MRGGCGGQRIGSVEGRFAVGTSSTDSLNARCAGVIAGANQGVAPRAAFTAADLRGKRVLIVDDSAMTARLMTQLLTRSGLVCTTAANGQEAVGAWRRALDIGEPFDITLMDKVFARERASGVG